MKKRLAILSSIILIAGCYQDPLMQDRTEERSSKIVNTPSEATEDMFAVQLTNTEQPSQLLNIDGVREVKKIFPNIPGKEEKRKKYGLDRWYAVYTEENTPIETIAQNVAKLSNVGIIQYTKKAKQAYVGKPVPYVNLATKAEQQPTGFFDDPLLYNQWHYYNDGTNSRAVTGVKGADINVKRAWELTCGDPSVIVAVIDEGVSYTHPDLNGNMWINEGEIPNDGIDNDKNGYIDDVYGYNFAADGAISWVGEKNSGHGTHVAGTVAGINNNGVGICGVAGGDGKSKGVRIMSCQIFDNGKGGNDASSAKAIVYAADNGAVIAQNSWGYPGGMIKNDTEFKEHDPLTSSAIDYFLDETPEDKEKDSCSNLDGRVVIFAAGNESTPIPGYPAGYHKVISVSAIGADNLPTYFTNWGPAVNIAAPGGEFSTGSEVQNESMVLSTMPVEMSKSGYGYMQGTSMACPHVSGIAALGLSYMIKKGIKMTSEEFYSKLLTSVNNIDNLLNGTKYMWNGDASRDSWEAKILTPYKKNMGTGTVDTWRFLMQLEGIQCLTAKVGEEQLLDIKEYMGDGAKSLTYLGISISEEDKAEIGLEKDPEIAYGDLLIYPTKVGSAVITVRAISGGDVVGDGSNIGGIEISRDIPIIVRPAVSFNGGWL